MKITIAILILINAYVTIFATIRTTVMALLVEKELERRGLKIKKGKPLKIYLLILAVPILNILIIAIAKKEYLNRIIDSLTEKGLLENV